MSKSVAVAEAARLIGVSGKTIREWTKEGKLQCHRTVGGHRRIPMSEIRRVNGVLGNGVHSSWPLQEVNLKLSVACESDNPKHIAEAVLEEIKRMPPEQIVELMEGGDHD